MFQYWCIVIIILVTSLTVIAQECTDVPRFDPTSTYSGHVVVIDQGDGKPTLQGDSSTDGIRFLVGCEGTDEPWVTLEGEAKAQFTIPKDVRGVGERRVVLAESYDLVTNMDIILTIKACKSETSTECAFAPVTITYPYNAHSPSFNHRIGQATIADAEACTGGCPAVFEPPFSGSDADGDVLEYSIIPFTEHSNLFEITDPSTLAISYKGNGVSQNEIITLLVQAKEKRALDDARSVVAVVKIEVLTTAEITTKAPTPSPECDDKNEKLYFIIMLALASVLGALLFLLILIPLCIKCCRSTSNIGISSSRKSTVKNAGVYTAGASYKSFSEMNYITLQDSPPSYTSSPELGVKVEKHASGRVRSRAKSSKRDLPSAGDSFSSDSTASVHERRRGDVDA